MVGGATTTTATTADTPADLPRTEIACSACLIKFETKELQRQHMKEDWHVYNIKRRVDSLPPLSITEFQEQLLTSNAKKDGTRRSSPFDKSCDACGLHYTSQKAWRAHIKSLKHEEKSSQVAVGPLSLDSPPSETSKESSKESKLPSIETPFDSSRCLFCNIDSDSLYSNLKHMSLTHSFFIPDPQYLIDIDSFLSYLSVIISEFHECLYCGSEKNSTFAVQEHMRNKGHCKFDLEDEQEKFGEFYDFEGDEDEDGDREEGESEGGKKEGMVLIADENELRLPSGKILSHRSTIRNARQLSNRRPSPSPQNPLLTQTESEGVEAETEGQSSTEPQSQSQSKELDLALRLRAGTSTSLIGVSQQQQRALIATEKKEIATETRKRNEYNHWLEKGANRQKRFKVKSMGKKQGGLEKRLG